MSDPTRAFGTLRMYLRPKPAVERCELCGRELASEHPHLLNLATRALACSCEPCALLFAGSLLTRPELAAVFDAGTDRNLFTASVAVLPRFWLLGRLSTVAAGTAPYDPDMLRAALGTLVFGLACVMLAIWEFERKDH